MAPSLWPAKYDIPKNPFIEGLQNYRDFLQHRFRVRQSNYLNIIGGAIVFPAIIIFGGLLNDKTTNEKFAREFPDRISMLEQRRRIDAANADQ